jgi:hypothetical protein
MCKNLLNYVPGFRKRDVITFEGKIIPSPPWAISSNLGTLIQNYKTYWDQFNKYEREARFHIEYSRIQPFEDSNKRIGRLVLATNMISEGYAPAIISLDSQEEYNQAICDRNYKLIEDLIAKSSKEEEKIMERIYNQLLVRKNMKSDEEPELTSKLYETMTRVKRSKEETFLLFLGEDECAVGLHIFPEEINEDIIVPERAVGFVFSVRDKEEPFGTSYKIFVTTKRKQISKFLAEDIKKRFAPATSLEDSIDYVLSTFGQEAWLDEKIPMYDATEIKTGEDDLYFSIYNNIIYVHSKEELIKAIQYIANKLKVKSNNANQTK